MKSKLRMNTKKDIAKEILYFFSLLVFAIIIYGVVEIKNSYNDDQIQKLSIIQLSNEHKIDSLNKLILSKNRKEKLIEGLTILFKQGASDEVGRLYSRDFKIKFGDQKVFKQIDEISINETKNKKKLVKFQNSYIDNGISGITTKSIVVLLILLYPIRFSILLIRWSIRTVRQK